MTHVGRWVAVVLVSILLWYCGGCHLTPAQRLAQVQKVLTVTGAQAEVARQAVAQFEAAARSAQEILSDPNLPAGQRSQIVQAAAYIEGQLAQYRPVLESLETRVAKLQELVERARAAGDDVDLGTEIQTYGQGLALGSGSLPPPFNAYGAAAGMITTLVGGVIGSITRARKAKSELAAQQQQTDDIVHGIVSSVNALIESDVVKDTGAAKKILKDYQIENAPEARAAVRKAMGLAS